MVKLGLFYHISKRLQQLSGKKPFITEVCTICRFRKSDSAKNRGFAGKIQFTNPENLAILKCKSKAAPQLCEIIF
jgi:hypothetical protein